MTEQPELSEAGLAAAGQALLDDDYDHNEANTNVWDDLARNSQDTYLLKARQVVTAYLTAAQD